MPPTPARANVAAGLKRHLSQKQSSPHDIEKGSTTSHSYVASSNNSQEDGNNHHAENGNATAEDFIENELLVGRSGPQKERTSVSSNASSGSALPQRLKIGFYFSLWYALNVAYNIANKKVLNVLPAPLTVASIQLGIGAIYVRTLWLLHIRPSPRLAQSGISIVRRVGICHTAGQLLTVTALGAGTVSFTHIVKASEPFFSAAVSAIVFRRWMKLHVYATLIPVVGGVAYACLKDRYFSLVALLAALGSNIAFALRAVYSKAGMDEKYVGDDVTPANLYGSVTCFSFLLSLVPAVILEGASFPGLWHDATEEKDANGISSMALIIRIVISGLTHYTNNEVMFLALSNVHPVTLAVGNTLKRVFIIIASVVVFNSPLDFRTAIGSAIGIGGVFSYSLAKQRYEKSGDTTHSSRPSRLRR
mmetsp:Transcript_17310/g.37815  ORF Transcript_17310/g.37815 Transcript_17310/m.37815 type:complete len:419 (+) Transcript_17310:325-1581(+)